MAKLRCCKDSKSKEKTSLRQGYVTKALLIFEDNGRNENQRMIRAQPTMPPTASSSSTSIVATTSHAPSSILPTSSMPPSTVPSTNPNDHAKCSHFHPPQNPLVPRTRRLPSLDTQRRDSILDHCISLKYDFYKGTRRMKLLDSNEIRQLRDVCIFEVNGIEVYM